MVVETRGQFVRVQVKSTTALRPEGCYRCSVRGACTSPPYKRGDFDFVAVYVIPEDLWYIIPRSSYSAKGRQSCFTPPTPPASGPPTKKPGTCSATTAAALPRVRDGRGERACPEIRYHYLVSQPSMLPS
jgi:hypothetical protein